MQVIVTLGTLTLIALNSSEGLNVLYFSAPFSVAEFIPLGFLLAFGIYFLAKQGYERRRIAVPLIAVALIGLSSANLPTYSAYPVSTACLWLLVLPCLIPSARLSR